MAGKHPFGQLREGVGSDVLAREAAVTDAMEGEQTFAGLCQAMAGTPGSRFPDLTPEEQAAYLDARAARFWEVRFAELVAKAGTTDAILPGDELPAEWQNKRETDGSAAGE